VDKLKFTEKDKEDVIKFLNTVAEKAQFSLNTKEIIDFFKLLSSMQQNIIPKIEANILEIKKVVQADPEEEKKGKGKK
jgi:hypothetical protein